MIRCLSKKRTSKIKKSMAIKTISQTTVKRKSIWRSFLTHSTLKMQAKSHICQSKNSKKMAINGRNRRFQRSKVKLLIKLRKQIKTKSLKVTRKTSTTKKNNVKMKSSWLHSKKLRTTFIEVWSAKAPLVGRAGCWRSGRRWSSKMIKLMINKQRLSNLKFISSLPNLNRIHFMKKNWFNLRAMRLLGYSIIILSAFSIMYKSRTNSISSK